MTFSQESFEVFERSIADYHKKDNVDTPIANPYKEKSIEFYLYLKNWIDTVQWHLEDIIRDPEIDPVKALAIKRRIDRSNQDRTDLVILALKIFHMKIEAERTDTSAEQQQRCREKLSVLMEQKRDLSGAIDMLLDDMAAGRKYMKVYKQMKMYNDPSLNPVLYGQNGSK